MYYSGIEGPNPLISRRKERYVAGTIQLESMPLVEQVEQTQYLVRVTTFGLKQLVLIPRGVPIQQTMVASLHVNIPLPLDYLFMVMVFQFNNQKRLIHIHNQVENHLEVYLMENCQEEEDHFIETHLEDSHLIHLLDFTNGWHLIGRIFMPPWY
jgi:hypothetical protein